LKVSVDVGNLYIVAAPSGTGKTTLVKALVDALPKISVSISHTTREKRPNEKHGTNYYFIDKSQFENMIEQGDFLEYATIFDHYYGTSKSWVEETLAKGIDVVLEIDWQGNQQIKRLFPDVISIFILPPTLQDLQNRLIKRNQDHPDIIKKRIADAKEAVMHIKEFSFVVINDDFSKALHDLTLIIEAGRLAEKRQLAKHATLLKEFADMG
jgi:guanylate kinase